MHVKTVALFMRENNLVSVHSLVMPFSEIYIYIIYTYTYNIYIYVTTYIMKAEVNFIKGQKEIL